MSTVIEKIENAWKTVPEGPKMPGQEELDKQKNILSKLKPLSGFGFKDEMFLSDIAGDTGDVDNVEGIMAFAESCGIANDWQDIRRVLRKVAYATVHGISPNNFHPTLRDAKLLVSSGVISKIDGFGHSDSFEEFNTSTVKILFS